MCAGCCNYLPLCEPLTNLSNFLHHKHQLYDCSTSIMIMNIIILQYARMLYLTDIEFSI
jgi:hypothetical protein